jgi:uncharacterized membrane protein (DUF2068 family)
MTSAQKPSDSIAQAKSVRGAKLLRLIGVFKLLKGLLLLVAAIWALKLSHEDMSDVALEWARRMQAAPGARYVRKWIEKLLSLDARDLRVLAGVLCAYSVMFTVEGIGLLRLKHWAEWMAVITTSGLIPFELYELVHEPTALKAGALALNVAIAVYLAVHVLREQSKRESIPNEN